MTSILAKSRKDGCDRVTLQKHTRHVIDAACALFGNLEPTRLGRRWLEFFRLNDSIWPSFSRHLVAACALHDWGKANNSFQSALHRTGQQAIRHEHLSTLLIGLPEVTGWLEAGGFDVPLVMAVVYTHHLKAGIEQSDLAGKLPDGQRVFELLLGEEFQQLIDDCAETLGLARLDATGFPKSWEFGRGRNRVDDHQSRVYEILRKLNRDLRHDSNRQRMLLALRSALIAADAAGSGLVREGHSIAEWIAASKTNAEPLTKQRVWDDIITKRVEEMRSAGKWHDAADGREGWSDFQIACDDMPGRALLLAPCGSGKTLAAWRWIAAQLERRRAGHVLFLYPTRATAREGFKDYVSWAPEADAALMHGTSEFDLDDMFVNPPDEKETQADPRQEQNYEVERKLFSLAYWPRRAFSATVDQFLAFLQYGYGPMCMLPVLADSIVVIDEVHSFDRNMFSALKDFLKNFDVPVLCMTATLPTDRRDQLTNECGLAASPDWPDDLMAVAELDRYRVRHVSDRGVVDQRVREALDQGKRVLWVVNQVRRAHDVVAEFAANFDPGSASTDLATSEGVPVVCYHSRFRLSDRVSRHADIMRLLKKPRDDIRRAALGVTTQVCEMSLDIDVDLLVTEECPVTSLVQRMGRCNRQRAARSLATSGEILVYPAEESAPYEANDLKGVPEFLDAVDGRDLSQAAIEQIMTSVPAPKREGDPWSRFLTSGPFAVGPKEDGGEGFREGDEFNRPCVLPEDVRTFLNADKKTRDGLILPVPRRWAKYRDFENNSDHVRLPTYIGVAAPDHYHAAIGYCDHLLIKGRPA